MSDIFYSQVDDNLQTELNSRARTGRTDRSTDAIRYMVEKIANVQVISYEFLENGDLSYLDTLHGQSVISSKSGFMANGESGFLSNDNISKRIPPFITAMDVVIGDNSNGLLNTCTFNITVPDPGKDLDKIEKIYCRPGRKIECIIEHPNSAIVSNNETSGILSDSRTDSTKKLLELSDLPETYLDVYNKFKMNRVVFDGTIIKFDLQYQTDFSVIISISARGTSHQYTDLSLIMENDVASDKVNTINLDLSEQRPQVNETENSQVKRLSFSQQFTDLVDKSYNAYYNDSKRKSTELEELVEIEYRLYEEIAPYSNNQIIWGNPYETHELEKYVNLSWVISFLNKFIILKQSYSKRRNLIICTSSDQLCVSNIYPLLCSADPENIFFPSQGGYDEAILNNYSDVYGRLRWFNFKNFTRTKEASFNQDSVAYTENININVKLITEIANRLEQTDNFTVNEFLKELSSKIYNASGGAINLKLITHPILTDFLLYYDCNYINIENVKPYSVPMALTNGYGTAVKDFKISSKLPENLSSLMYTVTQKPNQVSDSKIAPFISYLYADATPESRQRQEQEYLKLHEKYSRELLEARRKFGETPTSTSAKEALANALKKYVQYPTPSIKETLELTPPIIPFDAEFTIDGINGFRYGDVLTFNILPERFRYNTVFLVVGVNHVVSNIGEWNTVVRCIGRPKID